MEFMMCKIDNNLNDSQLNQKYLTKSDEESQNTILEKLSKYSRIYFIGPNGMGKTTILTGGIEKLTKKLNRKVIYFDFNEILKKGSHHFYQEISDRLAKNDEFNENIAIDDLSELIIEQYKEPILLIFDSVRTKNTDFLNRFYKEIELLLKQAKANSEIDIKIILSGSTVLNTYVKSNKVNSDFIVYVKPLSFQDARYMVKEFCQSHSFVIPPDVKIDKMIELSKGNRFLIREFAKFVNEKSQEIDVEGFILHIWASLKKFRREKDKKLSKHFGWILDNLQEDHDFYIIVLSLSSGIELKLEGNLSSSNDYIGIIQRENSKYVFANSIYEVFFKKLYNSFRLCDYGIYHFQNKELWQEILKCYSVLYEKNNDRAENNFFPNHIFNKNNLENKLIHIALSTTIIDDIKTMLNDILSMVFSIKEWDIYEIDERDNTISNKDLTVSSLNLDNRIEINDHISYLIKESLKNKMIKLDWKGEFLVIPVILRNDFGRVFISRLRRVHAIRRNYRVLTNFINYALISYYNAWSKNELEKRLVQISKTEEDLSEEMHPVSTYSSKIKLLWELSKEFFIKIGIETFTLYTIDKNNEVRATTNAETELSRVKHIIDDKLLKVKKLTNDNDGIVDFDGKVYVSRELSDTNELIILELNDDSFDKDLIDEFMSIVKNNYDNIVDSYNNEKMIKLLTEILLNSEDYIYILDKRKNIIFRNNRFENFLKNEKCIKGDSINRSCSDIYWGEPDRYFCNYCAFDKSFISKEPIRLVREVKPNKFTYFFDCAAIPIVDRKDGEIIAVSIFMHDITERMILSKAIETAQGVNSLDSIESLVVNTLKKFKFSRIFQWRQDDIERNKFVSENLYGDVKDNKKANLFKKGKKEFINNDADLKKNKVTVWYRRNMDKDDLKELIELRLSKTSFNIKESKTWPKAEKGIIRPDLWVTVPMVSDDGVQKLYVLDNYGDDEKDKENINLDKLQMIETFALAVAPIFQSIKKRNIETQLLLKKNELLKREKKLLNNEMLASLGKMAAGIAHEFNSPLAAIMATAQSLIKDSEHDKFEEVITVNQLKIIVTYVKALAQRVKDVRNYASGDKLKTERLEIGTVLSDTLSLFGDQLNKNNIEVKLDIARSLPDITANKYRLQQLFINLINNSTDAILENVKTEKKSKQIGIIVIKASFQRESYNRFVFEYSDSGIGLDDTAKEKIFNSLFTTKSPKKGLGLGMSIVKDIINELNGEIRVGESEYGGAKFTIFFPF